MNLVWNMILRAMCVLEILCKYLKTDLVYLCIYVISSNSEQLKSDSTQKTNYKVEMS